MDAPATTSDLSAECDALEHSIRSEGPVAALDRLVATLGDHGSPRALLDALLLKARHELSLPLIQDGSLADLPETVRTQFEDRYVAAIRTVGQRLLSAGEIPAAWPYFRAIGEKEPVATALDAYAADAKDPQLGQIIEVAFNQGAHPGKGFQLILEHYGACSAITAFEHLPADEAVRTAGADRLVRHLYAQLDASLRADIARHGQPVPPEGTSITELVTGRDWLFTDDAYHIDVSHLAAVVRMGLILTDPATIQLAVGLADYGRNLSPRHQYESDPPFERLYDDHVIYLRALLGRDVDSAIAHFRSKITPASADGEEDTLPAQVLVRLLVRLGRLDEAIDVSAMHLAGYPDSSLICPSLAQICQRAGRPDRLAVLAREQGDLVNYVAALLRTRAAGSN
jgi:hypothetical protein